MEDFGARLAAARKAQGLTQEQLAQQLHVSRQTVSHWETGRVVPDVVTAQQIAQALDVGLTENAVEEESPQAAGEARPAVRSSRVRPAGWVAIGAGLTLLLVTLLGLLLMPAKEPKQAESAPQALVIVTPSTEAAYLQERPDIAPGWVGWDVEFSYQNVSDVPFTPYGIIVRIYREDELLNELHVDGGYLVPHMGNGKLVKGNNPLRWPVANNYLESTRMECTIYGVDDNGNELSFSADVHYINAFAP